MNLESLRRKRVHRMGVKTQGHAGQRRIFFVLDRATRKFHGDLSLWMQYLGFARQQKASKKVSQVLTSMIRLHPTRPELWIYAANYSMDERGDMTEARSYMQRGLRFCKYSRNLWIEYTRLEMIYMAKIAARRQVLGLNKEPRGEISEPNNAAIDAEAISLPAWTAADVDPNDAEAEDALQKLSGTPALSGAIPIAIFDAAIKQFEGDASFGGVIFDMVAEFQGVPCLSKILHHIVDVLLAKAPTSPAALIRFIREPVIGVDMLSADFPRALSTALDRLGTTLQETPSLYSPSENARHRKTLSKGVVDWILSMVEVQDVDQDIRRVLSATLRKMLGQYRTAFQEVSEKDSSEIAEFAIKLRDKGFQELAEPFIALGLQLSPRGHNFLSVQD